MAIAKLSIDLEARLANLSRDLDRAVGMVDNSAKRMAAPFDALNASLAKLGVALSAGAIVAFVRSTAAAIENIKDLSEATGASVENISALEDVAIRTGSSFDVASDALVRLNKALADAKPGSETEAAFQALGLSVKELRALDPVDALQRVAEAQAKFADDGNKARIMLELTGKNLRDVVPLLNDMAERGKGVATVTREQAEAAERFNQSLAATVKNAQDLARALVGDVLPALNRILVLLNEVARGPGLLTAVGEAFKGNVFREAGEAVSFYTRKLSEVEEKLAALRADKRPLVSAFNAREIAALEEQKQKLEQLRAAYQKVQRLDVPQASYSNEGRFNDSRPSLPPSIGGTKTTSVKQPEDLQRALRAIESTDAAKIAELTATLERLFSLQAKDPSNLAIAQAIESVQSQLSKLKDPSLAAALSALENTDVAKLEKLRATLNSLLNMRAGAGDSPALAEAITDVTLAIDELNAKMMATMPDPKDLLRKIEYSGYDETNKLMREMEARAEKTKGIAEELGMTFSSAFEDAIVAGRQLSDVLRGLAQDILRLFVRKTVTEPLAASLANMFGGFKLFAAGGVVERFDRGGIVNNKTLFPFASGIGMMGEVGPEAILPLKRGADGKLGVTLHRQNAREVAVNVTINVAPGASADDFRRSQRQIEAVMSRSMRRAAALA